MEGCQAQLNGAEHPALLRARRGYWWAVHGFVVVAAASDLLRWCGCGAALTDSFLAFRSPRLERWRLRPFYLMLVPFGHLAWLHSRSVEVPAP